MPVILRSEPSPEESQGQVQPQPQTGSAQTARPQPAPMATVQAPQSSVVEPSTCPVPPMDLDDMYMDDDVDPDVLMEMEMNDVARNTPPTQRKPPVGSLAAKPKSVVNPTVPTTNAIPAPVPNSTVTGNCPPSSSSTVKAPPASSAAAHRPRTALKTSPYFPPPSSSPATAETIPDIGLSPVRAASLDFDITWDSEEGGEWKNNCTGSGSSSKTSANVSSAKLNSSHDSTNISITTTKPQSVIKPSLNASKAKDPGSSPDPYDLLSLDMDVDEEFLAQVGRIERGALAAGDTNEIKGKQKDPGRDPHARGTTPSTTGRGTKSFDLCLVSPGTSAHAKSERRVRSASISSGRIETSLNARTRTRTGPQPLPSTQPSACPNISLARLPAVDANDSARPRHSRRRPPREPSIIVISSSSEAEDGDAASQERRSCNDSETTAFCDPSTKNNASAVGSNNTHGRSVKIEIIDISD
ncbi:hypothetical protein F5I97DRAFT_1457030 [Phlebopus sp. FC_14]|nr:hypothetical protein F5I97DRAFT_1457030 [Phlebopus sp. FC_14]